MPTKLTVFGTIINEGETAVFCFDLDGKLVGAGAAAAIRLEFSIDEDREPLCVINEGEGWVDHDGGAEIYLGGLSPDRDAISLCDGLGIISKTFESAAWGDHYIFTLRNRNTTYDHDELRAAHRRLERDAIGDID
jgi:hypothetical protein